MPPLPEYTNFHVDGVYGCWLWHGELDRDGYGRMANGRTRAHHAVWRELVGPIPEGHELDHLCRRRSCVRPEHLEPVTRRDNELRKRWRHRVRRPTCRRGHDMKANAAITPEGGRVCRICSGVRMERGA